MGHTKQTSFFKTNWKHKFAGGGELRKKRRGRLQRPLSTKEPLHLVFKADKNRLKSRSFRSSRNFKLVNAIIQTYSKRFFIKIEQISIQSNHIHLLIRTSRRSHFHYFFRVVAGQIAQRFEQEGFLSVTDTPRNEDRKVKRRLSLWQFRPFSRVIRGYKNYLQAKDYVQLNYKEAIGEISYKKNRLRGLSMAEWEILWR